MNRMPAIVAVAVALYGVTVRIVDGVKTVDLWGSDLVPCWLQWDLELAVLSPRRWPR